MDLKTLKSQWDRVFAIVLTIAGAVCLLIGIIGVNDKVLVAEQTRYIVAGGIAGLFLLGLGSTLLISADLRDEWRKLDRIERALGDGVLRWAQDGTAPATSGGAHRSTASAADDAAEDAADDGDLADSAASREHA